MQRMPQHMPQHMLHHTNTLKVATFISHMEEHRRAVRLDNHNNA